MILWPGGKKPLKNKIVVHPIAKYSDVFLNLPAISEFYPTESTKTPEISKIFLFLLKPIIAES